MGFSIGALFFGPISDHIGRRPVVIASMAFSAITSLVACITPNLTVLFIARFLQGVGLVGVMPQQCVQLPKTSTQMLHQWQSLVQFWE